MKLSADEVIQIRALLKNGTRKEVIAEKYHITVGHVYDIRRRKVWKHLPIASQPIAPDPDSAHTPASDTSPVPELGQPETSLPFPAGLADSV